MENNKFAQNILGKIKDKNIKPKPKWHFLLKDYIVWLFGFFALFLGSLSFSVLLYLMKNNDWEIYLKLDKSFLEFVLLTLPYFWILFLILFIFVVYYNIKHTKKGYRYPLWMIVFGSVFFSFVFGIFFYKVGFARVIDDVLGEKEFLYVKVFNPQVHFWSQSSKGRLSGVVVSIPNKNEFILLDVQQKEWFVDKTKAKLRLCPPKKCLHNDFCQNEDKQCNKGIEVGGMFKIIGEECGDSYFCAEEIFPVMFGNKFFERQHHKYFDNPPIIRHLK